MKPGSESKLTGVAVCDRIKSVKMSQMVDNHPLVMSAVTELRHFSADPEMRELERRRKLWRLEYYSGLAAAKAEGVTLGETQKGESMLLAFLHAKFHKVPKRIENALQSMTDPTALESLAAHPVDCQSLKEFEKALN